MMNRLTIINTIQFKRFRQKSVLNKLEGLREQCLSAGGTHRVSAQHSKGKLTARQRLLLLLDSRTFSETDALVTSLPVHNSLSSGMQSIAGDGVVTGTGEIYGKSVAVYAQEFGVHGGSLSRAHANKICKIMDWARKCDMPLIGINDSGGARIQEGVDALAGYADIFHRNVSLSGQVPQISLIMGPCAGGAVYSPALTDFTLMTGSASMFVTGPDVVKEVMKEEVSAKELGGAEVHCGKSGVAHGCYESDIELLKGCRGLVQYITQLQIPFCDVKEDDPVLDSIVLWDSNQPYDMHRILKRLLDHEDFFELHKLFAPNIIIGFGRLFGHTIGVVANQPLHSSGVLDINSSIKAARFVRFCSSFGIPLLTLVDVPGFMPGTQQEHSAIIRNGAKLIYAYSECTSPKLTVIVRKAYGGAYCVMSSKHLNGDVNLAWPTAEIAVMGAKSAVRILFKEKTSVEQEGMIEKYENEFSSPIPAALRGYVDAVIEPRETRKLLTRALKELLGNKKHSHGGHHGNIPL